MSKHLNEFEGRDVVQATIRLTNAGDGLSQAMAIDAAEYQIGDRLYMVIEGEVTKVQLEQVKDTDVLARVHVVRAGLSTIVDEDFAAEVLKAQAFLIEESKGIKRLPLDGNDDDGGDE